MTILYTGDSRELIAKMDENSIDSIVCDPPYEIGFMGKKWDSTGIAYDPEFWALCLRVLKPGGHLVSFGACRTYHRIACAIEDAQFQVRDCLQWVFGTGFPKSLDISKSIDKAAGAEREVIHTETRYNEPSGIVGVGQGERTLIERKITAPATPEAQQWDGWGTALKPAYEPIILARKPLAGTVASTVLEYGTGGLNVDGCRVGDEGGVRKVPNTIDPSGGQLGVGFGCNGKTEPVGGRWPPNVLLSHEAAAKLGDKAKFFPHFEWDAHAQFMYAAKASRKEREAGCEGLPGKSGAQAVNRKEGSAGMDNPRAGSGRTAKQVKNYHPTVKPISVLRWLTRLVTPPGGIVLDPFMGSGSCGIAAKLEGFEYVGIEMNPDYAEIARARIEHWGDE